MHHLQSPADPLGAALASSSRGRVGVRRDGAAAAVFAGSIAASAVIVAVARPYRRRRAALRRQRLPAAPVLRAAAPSAPHGYLPSGQGRRPTGRGGGTQVRDHLDGDGCAVPDASVDAAVRALADEQAELDVG